MNQKEIDAVDQTILEIEAQSKLKEAAILGGTLDIELDSTIGIRMPGTGTRRCWTGYAGTRYTIVGRMARAITYHDRDRRVLFETRLSDDQHTTFQQLVSDWSVEDLDGNWDTLRFDRYCEHKLRPGIMKPDGNAVSYEWQENASAVPKDVHYMVRYLRELD
jgi:hypothetical protein